MVVLWWQSRHVTSSSPGSAIRSARVGGLVIVQLSIVCAVLWSAASRRLPEGAQHLLCFLSRKPWVVAQDRVEQFLVPLLLRQLPLARGLFPPVKVQRPIRFQAHPLSPACLVDAIQQLLGFFWRKLGIVAQDHLKQEHPALFRRPLPPRPFHFAPVKIRAAVFLQAHRTPPNPFFLLIVAGGQSAVDKALAVSREGGSAKLSDLSPCAGHHPDPWELDVFVHAAGQLSQTAGAASYPRCLATNYRNIAVLTSGTIIGRDQLHVDRRDQLHV